MKHVVEKLLSTSGNVRKTLAIRRRLQLACQPKRIQGLLLIIFISFSFSFCNSDSIPEKKAVDLARKSYALGGDSSVELKIEKMIVDGKGDIKPIGWDVSELGNYLYLVTYRYNVYSFEEGTGERGYFFEVDLQNESVIDVTDQYLQRMKPLTEVYKDEKEILDDLIEDSGELEGK